GRKARRQAGEGEVRPRRSRRSTAPDPADGRDGRNAGDAAGGGQDQEAARRCPDRREHHQAPGGDHLVDDQGRAAQSQAVERLAPAAHCIGLRHFGAGDQPPAEALPGYGRRHKEDEKARPQGPGAPRSRRTAARRVSLAKESTMSLKIRLARGGAKKRPYYSIVVADSRSPRDGRFIEKLGTYNPMLDRSHADRVTLKTERIQHWLGV